MFVFGLPYVKKYDGPQNNVAREESQQSEHIFPSYFILVLSGIFWSHKIFQYNIIYRSNLIIIILLKQFKKLVKYLLCVSFRHCVFQVSSSSSYLHILLNLQNLWTSTRLLVIVSWMMTCCLHRWNLMENITEGNEQHQSEKLPNGQTTQYLTSSTLSIQSVSNPCWLTITVKYTTPFERSNNVVVTSERSDDVKTTFKRGYVDHISSLCSKKTFSVTI